MWLQLKKKKLYKNRPVSLLVRQCWPCNLCDITFVYKRSWTSCERDLYSTQRNKTSNLAFHCNCNVSFLYQFFDMKEAHLKTCSAVSFKSLFLSDWKTLECTPSFVFCFFQTKLAWSCGSPKHFMKFLWGNPDSWLL